MTVKRAMLEIESTGTEAFFETEVVLHSGEQVGPVLLVEVVDFTEALEVVETLNRSKAQKRRERKPAEAAPENSKPGAIEPSTVTVQTPPLADSPTFPPRRTGA